MKILKALFVSIATAWVATGLIFVIAALVSGKTHAAEIECDRSRVAFGGWSNHFIGTTEEVDAWNESHRMVGYGCDEWSIRYFRNSYDVDAFAIDRTFYAYRGDGFRWGAYVGLWSGYEDWLGEPGITPAVAPKFEVQVDHHIWADFLVTPPIQAVYLHWEF